MSDALLYEARWIWDGTQVRAGSLGVQDGKVVDPAQLPAGTPRISLPDCALLPGLVNAHSHAFQRLLRGRVEYADPSRPREDFWTWREQMYDVASRLTPEGVFAASRQAFVEMALAGITTVGEFHYLHHQPDGTPYAEPNLLAQQVIRAAREVGLRIVLLRVGYARAGAGKALDPRQRRFVDAAPERWLEAAEALAVANAGDPLVSVGLAPHSVRALPRPWLEALARHGGARPLHMHVAEQPAEVRACMAEHGQRPVELLESVGLLSPRFIAVHGIQLTPDEMRRLAERGAGVCACPTTERNLGDGIVPADALLAQGIPLSLGSDSQFTIDLLEEAAALEGNLRLAHGRRNVLDPLQGSTDGLAARLLGLATRGGARALGLPGGTLQPGQPADFLAVQLTHPTLVGADATSLLPGLLAGGAARAVREVWVAGRRIVSEARHPLTQSAGSAFASLAKT